MNAQKKMTHFIVRCKIRNGNSFLFLSRVLSKMVDAGDAVEEKSNINSPRVSINATQGDKGCLFFSIKRHLLHVLDALLQENGFK